MSHTARTRPWRARLHVRYHILDRELARQSSPLLRRKVQSALEAVNRSGACLHELLVYAVCCGAGDRVVRRYVFDDGDPRATPWR